MKKRLGLIAIFVVSSMVVCYSQQPGKVVFDYTPDETFEDRLDIPVDISVRIERICLTSTKKFANFPDGIKNNIADDLGTIFNNRVIEGGGVVNILIEVKTLMFDFERNFFLRYFLPFIGSTKFIGIAELDVTIYESDSMNMITSYQINHRISERDRQAQSEKYYDFCDSDDNIVLQVLKEAMNETKRKILKDRETIEVYLKTR